MGVVWTFLSPSIFSPFFLPLSETARHNLKYVSKGNPPPPPPQKKKKKKKKTNKPNPVVSGMRMPVYGCYHIYSKVWTKNAFRSVDSGLTTHSMILDSISRRFVVLNLQNSFPAGSFPRENWLHFFSFFSTALSFSFKFHRVLNFLAFCEHTMY